MVTADNGISGWEDKVQSEKISLKTERIMQKQKSWGDIKEFGGQI